MPIAFKDNLTQFMEFWLAQRPIKAPVDGNMRVGKNSGVVLFRDGRYQVQMFVCDAGSEIPDHLHPHVDSFAVYVSGDVYFRKNGTVVITPEAIAAAEATGRPLTGLIARVAPTDWHGATIGPRGGCFIGIEEWAPDVAPTSVHLDWDGPPIDDAHAAVLKG